MWPFKRKPAQPFCVHDWRLIDTHLGRIDSNPYSPGYYRERVPFFTVNCAICGKQRTMTETEFAHFRKYFNVKLPEVSVNETA